MRFATLVASAALTLLAQPSLAHAGETNGGPVIELSCGGKGKTTLVHDFSTGSAPWIVSGPTLAPGQRALATTFDQTTVPAAWAVKLPKARWIQASTELYSAPHPRGDYVFSLTFRVPKADKRMKLRLHGRAVADEQLLIELDEPAPANASIGSGVANQPDDSADDITLAEVVDFDIATSADGSRRALGSRPGIYTIRISVESLAPGDLRMGLLGEVLLTQTCTYSGHKPVR